MTDITPSGARYAVRRWEAAYEAYDQGRMAYAGDDLKDVVESLLDQLEAAQHAVEPVLPGETYTAGGVPRRAMSRAREHGARLTYSLGGDQHRVEFPDGSAVEAWTVAGARRQGREAGRVHNRYRGAAPGCVAPEGRTLEDVLNRFADTAEGRV